MLVGKNIYINSPKYHSTMKILHIIMWLSIVGIGVIALVRRKQFTFSTDDKIVFWGLFSFAAIYYASSIFAAPMEIRYVMSMHSIQFACCYILLNKLLGSKKEPIELKTTEKQPEKPIWKKILFPFKYAPIVYFVILFVLKMINSMARVFFMIRTEMCFSKAIGRTGYRISPRF